MKFLILSSFILGLTFISCKDIASNGNHTNLKNTSNETNSELSLDSTTVYKTENLIIRKLSNHIYVHISYLNTADFGKVSCNGMLVINENEGVLFDTPTDSTSSIELIDFVSKNLKSKVLALIPTHFHNDCVGGIAEFEKHDIPTYASKHTIELLTENGQIFNNPIKDFDNRLTLHIGSKKVYAEYFGEGHTKDNIVGYFPNDNAVFGGCLIKEVGAGKGYLGDANVKEWSKTVEKIQLKYPNAKIVIPGHGKWGGTELFAYTIKLFK